MIKKKKEKIKNRLIVLLEVDFFIVIFLKSLELLVE